ncbi:MAG: hypothetical protein Kow00106_09530 [Anaerolineae bacterium]
MAEDALLDELIREALLDEALSMPAPGAWERLRQAIGEGAAHRHGMWVFEEVRTEAVQRERQAARIEQQLSLWRHGRPDHWRQKCDALWGNMFPTYVALVNW